ncbi:hypothetical protein GJ699_01145 [Duganella sp. FT80W]|uniref:Porin n=1 Tax=Duganella guangzhouensis TaxID=2666084 RepID=A0A6I2KWK3_9BURK|nr:hypothetical protein [Duganella guangzhouensis]MRW88586.1 hypothetical protein [Duganella guangzhouensis]
MKPRLLLLLAFLPGLATAIGDDGRSALPVGGGPKEPSQLASGVELRAGKGDDAVTLKLSRYLSAPTDEPLPNGDRLARFTSGSVSVSTPLSKRKTTELLTLDGLATGTSVAFSYSSFSASFRPPTADQLRQRIALCDTVMNPKRPKNQTDQAADDQNTGCDSADIVKNGTIEQQLAWDRLLWGNASIPPTIWGVSAEVGFPTHDYVNPANLSSESSKEHPWSIGAYYAISPGSGHTIYTVNAKYQRSYEDGKDGVLCPLTAPTGATSLTCVSGALGAPVRQTKKLLALDARREFGSVAVGLTITHDFEQPATSVELPLYLIRNSDGKLNGGLKFGYRSDTKEYGAGVFIGSTFAIWQ